jgi:hypothetical protein
VVLMIASAPLGTPADQLAGVFQSALELPFQVLCAWLMESETARATGASKTPAHEGPF